MKKHWRKIAQYAIDTAFWLCMLGVVWIVAQVFLFTSFKIPSDSMEPELTAGDNILVWKPTVGPRLFDLSASMRLEQTEVYRVPGVKGIQRNDVLVLDAILNERAVCFSSNFMIITQINLLLLL